MVAHPDDDVLGCGGTLAKYSSMCSIRVVFIAEGTSCRFEKNDQNHIEAEISVRSDSAKRALKKLSISDTYFHNLPCGSLNVIPRIEINKIIHRLNLINFSISFKKLELPNSGELQREDYLPLKLPPLPSIDSAVESWVSGASNSRASNNNNFNGKLHKTFSTIDVM